MGAFTFTSITTGVMEKLHLRSKKSNKKVSSLTISSPIEGSFQRQPSHMSNVLADFLPGVLLEGLPDYHEGIPQGDPVMPRRYSDLVRLAEMLSRQVVGTKHAIAHHRTENHVLERENTLLKHQFKRAAEVVTNNVVLREEIVELKKQIVEEKRIADVMRRSGGLPRNKLKNDIYLLTIEKDHLEGVLKETRSEHDERDAKLESLALALLETLGGVRGAEQ